MSNRLDNSGGKEGVFSVKNIILTFLLGFFCLSAIMRISHILDPVMRDQAILFADINVSNNESLNGVTLSNYGLSGIALLISFLTLLLTALGMVFTLTYIMIGNYGIHYLSLFDFYFENWLTPCHRKEIILKCLFSWDEIRGEDQGNLKGFLKEDVGLEWISESTIIKKVNENLFYIHNNGLEYISLELKDNGSDKIVEMKLDEKHIVKFITKRENDEIKVYLGTNGAFIISNYMIFSGITKMKKLAGGFSQKIIRDLIFSIVLGILLIFSNHCFFPISVAVIIVLIFHLMLLTRSTFINVFKTIDYPTLFSLQGEVISNIVSSNSRVTKRFKSHWKKDGSKE